MIKGGDEGDHAASDEGERETKGIPKMTPSSPQHPWGSRPSSSRPSSSMGIKAVSPTCARHPHPSSWRSRPPWHYFGNVGDHRSDTMVAFIPQAFRVRGLRRDLRHVAHDARLHPCACWSSVGGLGFGAWGLGITDGEGGEASLFKV